MAASATARPDVQHPSFATEDEKAAVEEVMSCVQSFENGIGLDFKERNERFYRQYRGFRKFRQAWEAAGPNDRDGVVYDAKKHWGAHLHIPLSFRTIETMVPRAIAQRPRMLYLPRDERWEENVANVRMLLDAQQQQIHIDLPFQAVMRSGMIYGLGVGKSFWRREYRPRRRVKRRMWNPKSFVVGPSTLELAFDDPDFEDLDIFDFGWDPYGSNMRTCEWVYHRSWLSLRGCLDRIADNRWNTTSAQALDEEQLRKMGGSQRYDDIWQERMAVSGFASWHNTTRGEQIHELVEWHDGERVVCVLDRQVLVQDAENPCFGHLPFHIYRPTPLQKQMVGIGELEPVEHLQRELDTVRSQQRDAATLALCAGYAYDDSAIEEEDLVFGPAAAIRVTNARPQEALWPLPVREVPNSSWQDQQVIRNDFDAVVGINDALTGGDGGPIGTATEAQLVQAALSKRIENKSRLFEIETVATAAEAWLYLDQRMITSQRKPLPLPADGMTYDQAASEGRWKWFEVGPAELMGDYHIIPEGGSMAARNVPQDRQDGVQIMQLFGNNPYIDGRQPLLKALQLFGVTNPESWMKQTDPPVPPAALEVLQKMGVDPQLIQRAVQVAQARDPRLAPEQQGPDTAAVAAMMGSGPQPTDQGAQG